MNEIRMNQDILHETQNICIHFIKKANGILVFIAKRMKFRNRKVLLQQYRVLASCTESAVNNFFPLI